MTGTPSHQTRKAPTLRNWVDVLLGQARCPDCNEILGDKKGVQFDHVPPISDRWDEERWQGIDANDPRFAQIRHINCHQAKTNREHTERSKTKRVAKKHGEHREKMQNFELPQLTDPAKPRGWPKRPFPNRRRKE